MPNINSLGLKNEKVGDTIDYATIPEQMGGTYPDPPPPGTYRFKLPTKLDDIWEPFEKTTGKNPGQRIAAVLDESHPLTIIQSPKGEKNGEPFQTRISNAERKRGRADDATAPEVSDMDYLFKDAFSLAAKPPTNVAYATEFMKHGGQEFTADIEWSWYCNDKKDIRVDSGTGTGATTVVEGQKGCGQRYYQKDIDKVPSNPDDPNSPKVFPLKITCGQCAATLRAFPNLVRFRK